MNPTPSSPDELSRQMQSLWTFFALQLARIHAELYPEATHPKHVQGPRRPDMQDQEAEMMERCQ